MIRGWERATGAIGIRNHLLVLPTVVCSAHVVVEIARDRAVPIVHQHGCAVVGADVGGLIASLEALVDAVDVGAAVIVGLGCETIQTDDVCGAITDRTKPLVVLTIQESDGSEETVRRGQDAVDELRVGLDAVGSSEFAESRLVVGLDDGDTNFADALIAIAASVGASVVVSSTHSGEDAHLELTKRGAAVIVAVRGRDDGPCGFAVTPVVAATNDDDLFAAMPDDYDVFLHGDPADDAERVWQAVLSTARGVLTASERRGDRDVVFPRTAMSM